MGQASHVWIVGVYLNAAVMSRYTEYGLR
jgi:hypothetical protein